jgi:RHS repeat-associated protein
LYDAFGQRTYIEYGNGVRTSYAYDEDRRWLDSIQTTNSSGDVYQGMSYNFDLVGNVRGYTNKAGTYETSQSYHYDDLYQLHEASGTSVYKPYGAPEYTSTYNQVFTYDSIGNMTSKVSTSKTTPKTTVGDDLNYSNAYSYYAGKAHQAERIGDLYYRYDLNGNMIEEREDGHGTNAVTAGTIKTTGDVRSTDTGFGIVRTTGTSTSATKTIYARYYAWDEENRLIRSVDNNIAVDYRYGADGQRAAKYSKNGESLYFDSMWQVQTDYPDLRQLKNIYVGQTRIATRVNIAGYENESSDEANTYYYHPDHLGSAQLVTDHEGKEYERIEYTPYGESWIEKAADGVNMLPFRFTGKELDAETGLYYYGARYLNPKTSVWISADPALGEYLPVAPVDDEARKHNGNLPGQGGVFNLVNLAVYHYAANNPVKYTDPTGMWQDNGDGTWTAEKGDSLWELYGKDWKEYSGYKGDPKDLKPGDVVGEKRDKNDVPLAPSDANIDENIEKAKTMGVKEFYDSVRNKGPWDYKQKGEAYGDFGNFNFGATGKANGFPDGILKRAAGWAQGKAGTSRKEWGRWFGVAPYGDDPADQKQIQNGIDYFKNKEKK